MDLWTALTTLVRRWYVVVPALALAAALAGQAAAATEPTYRASASVLLVRTAPGENPYASFTASVTIAARALAEAARGDEFRATVRQGAEGTYSIVVQQDTPLLQVTAESDRAEGALLLLSTVVREVIEDLDARQPAAGEGADVRLVGDVLDMPRRAEQLTAARTRTFAGVLGLGVVGALAAAFVADSLLAGRRAALHHDRRRDERSTVPAT